MKKLSELVTKAQSLEKKMRISVAVAQDEVVLEAVDSAKKAGIIEATLVGDQQEIEKIAKKLGIDLSKYEIIDEKSEIDATRKAVEIVNSFHCDLLMKGKVHTSDLLHAVLDKNFNLRTGKTMNHVGIFEVPSYDRLLIITDAAMVIAPTLDQKIDSIYNATKVAHVMGIDNPKVAVLGAVETVTPAMSATLDAALLAKMSDRKQIAGAIVDGPFALDNAVSEEAAHHKGITGPVAGHADILLVPDIEAGNILYKGLIFIAKGKLAGTIVGARVPIVLTSRADDAETRLYSIALSALLAKE
jgi:phosphate butyryltransferase